MFRVVGQPNITCKQLLAIMNVKPFTCVTGLDCFLSHDDGLGRRRGRDDLSPSGAPETAGHGAGSWAGMAMILREVSSFIL